MLNAKQSVRPHGRSKGAVTQRRLIRQNLRGAAPPCAAASPLYQLAEDAAADATVSDVLAAVVDAPEAAVSEAMTAAVSAAADAASSSASSSMNLAAQRYAEMVGASAKAPKPKAPELPSFSMPDLGSFEMPKFTAPDLSKFSAPELPKLSAPDFSKLSAPDLSSLPKLSAPDLSKLSVPSDGLELPKIALPDFGGAASGLSAGVSGSVDAATSSVGKAASDAAASVSSAAANLTSGATGAISDAAGTVTGAVTGVTGAFVSQLSKEFSGVTKQINSATGGLIDDVSAATGSLVGQVESAVSGTAAQVYDSLPAPGQAVVNGLGVVVDLAAANPQATVAVAAAVALPIGYNTYMARYGGYSGDVSPEQVKQALAEDDNVVVVDVRKLQQRMETGTIQLFKNERYKAAAVPIDCVVFNEKNKQQMTGNLELQVVGFLIAGLKQVRSPLTKIVIMDDKEDDTTRDLARAVKEAGIYTVYVMQGGFRAWADAGLGVEEGRKEYEVSAVTVWADEVKDLQAGFSTNVAPKLRDPAFVLPGVLLSSVAAYSLYNYHTTLQYIGVWGIFATVYARLSQYDSPEQFLEEVQGSVSSVASGVSSLTKRAASAMPAPAPPKNVSSSNGVASSNGVSTSSAAQSKPTSAVSAAPPKEPAVASSGEETA